MIRIYKNYKDIEFIVQVTIGNWVECGIDYLQYDIRKPYHLLNAELLYLRGIE
jgi:hypothetical protein